MPQPEIGAEKPPKNWPIEITQQSEACVKILPAAKATLSVIKGLNGVAGVVKCFVPGVPTLSSAALGGAKSFLDELDQASSVAEFKTAQAVLDKEGDKSTGKQDGYSRREFKQLLDEKDAQHVWAEMERLLLVEARACSAEGGAHRDMVVTRNACGARRVRRVGLTEVLL